MCQSPWRSLVESIGAERYISAFATRSSVLPVPEQAYIKGFGRGNLSIDCRSSHGGLGDVRHWRRWKWNVKRAEVALAINLIRINVSRRHQPHKRPSDQRTENAEINFHGRFMTECRKALGYTFFVEQLGRAGSWEAPNWVVVKAWPNMAGDGRTSWSLIFLAAT